MLRGVLEAQAPPKQNATDTISTLSNRLANATLLEDRRGAILGLRSFAKTYPASVASGSLRVLIQVLSKDVDDVDTSKIVLETLLMLFNPNTDSPEASDDIALWLADEFSQRQDNISVLLSLLETNDFYSKLYALQLLLAVSSARPERTQDCILSAPLGTVRLVATLGDSRDAVRSAGLLLLTDVTQASPELQKLVAFENAFERILKLIKTEGSFLGGGIVVQDCLALLANLLDLNASNQSLFRETGFFGKLAKLLAEDAQEAARHGNGEHAVDQARDKNLWGLLAVLKMFLIQGNLGTQVNQNAFEKQGLLQLILEMGFDQNLGAPVRAEALSTCADIIRGNDKIQKRFGQNKVPSPIIAPSEADRRKSLDKVYVIEALLNVTLSVSATSMFDVRFAASECILAYFYGCKEIRDHFLRRAIEGHMSDQDETSNVFGVLIRGQRNYQSADPYRPWFAARIVLELLDDDSEAKKIAMTIREGDAESGEEVVTCLQALTGNLISCIQSGDDDRICVAYFMLLCGWLFDESDAVNDVLQEGSVVQSLIQEASRTGKGNEMITGFCAVFLGILYEFSTKDSPIPRRQLQSLITSGLGRENYISRIKRLRQLPLLRDFEVLPQKLSTVDPGGLPDVYFDQEFVNLLKDNFNRLIRAIDREPAFEVARMQQGVDRDLVDSLREQIEDKSAALQKASADIVAMEQLLGQEQADHRRTQETAKTDLARIKNINDALHKGHENELEKGEAQHRATLQGLERQYKRQLEDSENKRKLDLREVERRGETAATQHASEMVALQQRMKQVETDYSQSQEMVERFRRSQKDAADLLAANRKEAQQREALTKDLNTTLQQRDAQLSEARAMILEKESETNVLRDAHQRSEADTQHLNQLLRQRDEQIKETHEKIESLRKKNEELEKSANAQGVKVKELEKRVQELEVGDKKASLQESELRGTIKAKEEARQAAQTELDDLLIVLSDLEEKRTRDKRQLKELGAEVSDLEDEDEAEDDADVDDGDDNGEKSEHDEEGVE